MELPLSSHGDQVGGEAARDYASGVGSGGGGGGGERSGGGDGGGGGGGMELPLGSAGVPALGLLAAVVVPTAAVCYGLSTGIIDERTGLSRVVYLPPPAPRPHTHTHTLTHPHTHTYTCTPC